MNISIPENCENINILVSGGVDSTLLTYLVLQQYDKPVICHFINNSEDTLKRIFEPLDKYFKSKFEKRYTVRMLKHQQLFIRDAVQLILSVYPGVVLTGCNKVVTHFTPTVYIRGDTPPVRGPALNEIHLRPFIDMDKVEILKVYLKENILDLLKLTRSCGLPGTDRCNGCYFCMERAWAASVLNIVDDN